MKGFAIHNAPTDHGGVIPSTMDNASQMGNNFVRAGDGHLCPKCNVWSIVKPSHNHVIFHGKPVAYANDELTCGARILEQQSHVIGDSSRSSLSQSNMIPSTNNFKSDTQAKYSKRFLLQDELTGDPLIDFCYEIVMNGEVLHGKTDDNGFTELITSNTQDNIEIRIILEEHEHGI